MFTLALEARLALSCASKTIIYIYIPLQLFFINFNNKIIFIGISDLAPESFVPSNSIKPRHNKNTKTIQNKNAVSQYPINQKKLITLSRERERIPSTPSPSPPHTGFP
jgi:hypothetical protein